MSSNEIPSVEDVLAISDPGEKNRDQHTKIDRLMINIGNVVAWAFPLLMVAIVGQVFLRSAGYNQAWLDDFQWWVYGFAMLTAFGYAITTNSHVRVDILYQNFSDTKKARVEAGALGWLLLPFIALMTDVMFPYAVQSIVANEGSSSPNGLHNVWILKASLPVLFVLSGLAAYSVFRRNLGVFSRADLAAQLIWAFPAAIFVMWRAVHYVAWWYIRLTNDEITPRRISREPFFDYTLMIAAVLVIALILVALVLRRRKEA
jgi:TRAP-type mannitol/chloroaromatic compound transport system permease small subunit